MSQFKLELFANPICSLGDREKSTLNSLKPRLFIYKTRIIILIISDNISTSNREYFENKQVTNIFYTIHWYPQKWSLGGQAGRGGRERKKKKNLHLRCARHFQSTALSLFLQIRNLRLREVRQLSQDHRAIKWQMTLTPKLILLLSQSTSC